mmetsp:Transcript_33736/g.84583  ORF Transcript_33736/g.84583 Transcript_33736/m.84583 type:complete len:168 (+) Transcript_33736:537-1040(+)
MAGAGGVEDGGSDSSGEVRELMAQLQDAAALSEMHALDAHGEYSNHAGTTSEERRGPARPSPRPPATAPGDLRPAGGGVDESAAVQQLLAQAMEEVRLAKDHGDAGPQPPGLTAGGVAGLSLGCVSESDESRDDALSAKTGDDSDIEDLLLDLPAAPKHKPAPGGAR